MAEPAGPTSATSRRALLTYLLRGIPASGRWLAFVIAILTIVGGLLPAVAAVLSQRTFDAIVEHRPVVTWFVLFLVATFVLTVIGAIIEHLEAVLGRSVQARGLETLLDSVSGLPTLAEMEDPRFRDSLMVAQDAGTQAPTEVFNALMSTTRTVLTVVSMSAILWSVAPWSIPLVALGAAPIAFILWRRSHSQAALTWKVSTLRRRSDFYAQLLTDLQGAKEIRLFSTAPFFRRRMSTDLRQAIDEENGFSRRWTTYQVVAESLAALATGFVSVVMVMRTASGELSVGDLTMLLAAIAAIQLGLIQLLDSTSKLAARLMNFRTFVDLVERRGLDQGGLRASGSSAASDISTPDAAHSRPHASTVLEGLVFEDVWFRYPGSPEHALKGISLHVPRGSTSAIVGRNGSGKSTLVKLICRFYRPTRGRILWDGKDIWSMPIDEYRELLTGVFQDYMGYDLSVRENVAISDIERPIDDTAVWREIDAVGLGQRIREMDRGLDTMLSRMIYMDDDSDSNALLSGGQWQRLAVARARYRGARDIQLYDEPTANLDPMAEWEITRLLDQRHPRSVAVCISHRLQTVRGAQHIIVLEDGVLTEQGSHVELMALGGSYNQMYDRQQSSFLEQAVDEGAIEAANSVAPQDDREDLPAASR